MKVFKNADFISCEDSNRRFNVLVEDDGKIAYVGDHIPEFYERARQIDLKGACVVPAFGDTHIHFASFAFFNAGLDCRHVKDFDELAVLIRKYVDSHRREKIVLGFGCSAHTVAEKRLPNRTDLDRITTRPLMLVKYDGHAAVANSALVERLPSEVFENLRFEEVSGWFYLEAFYSAVNSISKSVPVPRLFKNLVGAGDYMAKKGIGLVHTTEGVGFPLDMDVDVMRFAALGLPQAYRVFFQTMAVGKVLRRKLPRIGGCFATALDGCFGSEDAALRDPYSNDPDNFGNLFYTQKQVDAFVKEAHDANLQIAMHAIGDAAVEQALVAYEKALQANPRDDHRHIIIHADLMDESAIEKTAELGVCIALQTPFLHWDQEPLSYLETLLGRRTDRMMPLKSMLDAGIVMASGSDGPCTLPDPVFGIYAACNHPNSSERIPVLDALKMHTAQCAKLSFEEDVRGTLTPGKAADFAVLDRNILDIGVEAIRDLQVVDLYLGGRKYDGRSGGAMGLTARCIKNKCFGNRR